MIIKKELEDLI